jgi:hypothetical protein
MVGAKEACKLYDHEYHCKSKQKAGQCPFLKTGNFRNNREPHACKRCITYENETSPERQFG